MLITAGPTYEPIDPVRFIGNHSSGKMGYAIAREFAIQGARVTLVSGPTGQQLQHENVEIIRVQTAAEMYEACAARVSKADIAVFAAAVADFTPAEVSGKKIKRGKEGLRLELQPTRDIAAELGSQKRDNQCFVGFALETDRGEEHAREKLERKNFDLIVLNSLEDKGAGFGTDTNKVMLIYRTGKAEQFALKPKSRVAEDIVNGILKYLNHG